MVFLDSQGTLAPEPALQPELLNMMFSASQTKIWGNENLLATLGNAAFPPLPSKTRFQNVPPAPGPSPFTPGARKHQTPMRSQDSLPGGRGSVFGLARLGGRHCICLGIGTPSLWSARQTGLWCWWLLCDVRGCPVREGLGALGLRRQPHGGSMSVSGRQEHSFWFAFTGFSPGSCWAG